MNDVNIVFQRTFSEPLLDVWKFPEQSFLFDLFKNFFPKGHKTKISGKLTSDSVQAWRYRECQPGQDRDVWWSLANVLMREYYTYRFQT